MGQCQTLSNAEDLLVKSVCNSPTQSNHIIRKVTVHSRILLLRLFFFILAFLFFNDFFVLVLLFCCFVVLFFVSLSFKVLTNKVFGSVGHKQGFRRSFKAF